MSLFSRLFGTVPRQVNDPVLGRLTRSEEGGSGQATWPHGGHPFALTVHRPGPIPQPSDIHAAGHLPLICGFHADADPEGAFIVGVRGRTVEPVG